MLISTLRNKNNYYTMNFMQGQGLDKNSPPTIDQSIVPLTNNIYWYDDSK